MSRSRITAPRRLLALALAASLALTAGAPLVGPAAASGGNAPTLTYDTAPADEASVTAGGTYDHSFSVASDAEDGPLIATVYFSEASGIAYAGHEATVAGTDTEVEVVRSRVVVDGTNTTRLQIVDRDPALDAGPLALTVSLTVPNAGATEEVMTGGVHAPSGTTLALKTTALSVRSNAGAGDGGDDGRDDDSDGGADPPADDDATADGDSSDETETDSDDETESDRDTTESDGTQSDGDGTESDDGGAGPSPDDGIDAVTVGGILGAVVLGGALVVTVRWYDLV